MPESPQPFQERGVPGFRRPVAVRSCTAFEPRSAIGYARTCLDPTFRRPLAPPSAAVASHLDGA